MPANQTALITGASSGIGHELATRFAQEGYNLVIVARNEQQLRKIAAEYEAQHNISVKVLPKDLSDPTAPTEIYNELQAAGITVDVLVNNAGFGAYGFFTETKIDAELQMMQVNMVALTHLTKLFLKDMVARKRGKIMNVASTAAFQPGPLMAVYYATKAYVLSFSEALANELQGTGVTITALCPGPTRSGFQSQAKMEESKLVSGDIMDSATVADIGYRGMIEGKTVVIPGLRNQLLALAPRLVPRDLATKLVRQAQERVHAN